MGISLPNYLDQTDGTPTNSTLSFDHEHKKTPESF